MNIVIFMNCHLLELEILDSYCDCFFLFLLTMFLSTVVLKVQNQLPEVFCKTSVNTCLFLMKLHSFRDETLLKKDSNTGAFCEYYEICKNYFENICEWLLLESSFVITLHDVCMIFH